MTVALFTRPNPVPPSPVPAPVPLLPGERAKYRAFVRVDGDTVGEIRRPTWPAPIVERRNAIGEHMVGASIDDPGLVDLTDTVGGAKVWRTWDTHDVEIEVTRQGSTVAVGPVVGYDHRPGQVVVWGWSREAYPAAAVIGPASRTNRLAAGYIQPGLSGWTLNGGVSASAVTSPTYRQPRAMRVNGGSGNVTARYVAPAGEFLNIGQGLVVARWVGGSGGWPLDLDDKPVVGQWTWSTRPIGGGPETVQAEYGVTLENRDEPGTWIPIVTEFRENPGVENVYDLQINAPNPGSTGWIGEAEWVRYENVSARKGSDRAELIAALYDYLVKAPSGQFGGGGRILPEGWSRYVQATGEILSENVRYDFSDHRDVTQALRDWEPYGDAWVELGTRLLRWGQRGRFRKELGLLWTDLVDPRAVWDAKDAVTEVITLADGADGPTREEAYARRLGSPHRLMRVEQARPRGLPVKELSDLAARLLDEEGPATVAVSGGRGRGPLLATTHRDLSGAWWHKSGLGDSFPVRVVDPPVSPVVDYTVRPRVDERRLDPNSDAVEMSSEVVRGVV